MKHATRNLLQLFLCTISASVLSTGVCAQNAEYDYKQTGLPVCFVDFDPSITITKEEKTKAVITLCTTSDTLKSDVNISGRGNNTLAPTAGATRAEMAVMLQQFVKLMEK